MPLSGIRVVELAGQGPAPYCSMVLGDLGADVVIVERPPTARTGGGAAGSGEAYERARAHQALRRNKRSITLNLREDDAREALYRLVDTADVFIESYRPGVVVRLGVDYETLIARNPRLVYCSVSGYGQTGPYAQVVGHDVNYISIAGALSMIGRPGQRPAIPQNVLADFAAGGQAGVIGILAALMARTRTGRGQHVDIAMTDSVLYTLASAASGVLGGGAVPRAGEGMLAGGVPFIDVYETSDGGYVSVAALEPHFWETLCTVVGHPEFVPWQHDRARHAEIRAAFERAFRSRTRDEWAVVMREQEACLAPVLFLDEALEDPHNRAREMVVEVEDAAAGPVRQIGVGPKLSGTPGGVRRTAPRPGADTDEVLAALGYTGEEVEKLRKSGAVA